MIQPRISLVCTTIGRPAALSRLLGSIATSELADQIEFVLVDQSVGQESAAVLRDAPMKGLTITLTSGRGASVGRNVGTIAATAPVIAYPDDNCWYGPSTLREVVDLLDRDDSIAGVSAKQVTQDGSPSMLRWPTHPTDVSRTNFLRTSICSTLFFRRSSLPSPAPFDEGIGVGSPGLRGAGEESDLLLRVLANGHKIRYEPSIHVFQDDDRDDRVDSAFVDKMYKYGVGNGHLWRSHRLPMTILGYYTARKLVGAGVRYARGEKTLAQSDVSYLRGELDGFLGKGKA